MTQKAKLSEIVSNAEDTLELISQAIEKGNLEFATELSNHVKNVFIDLDSKIDDYIFIIKKKQAEKKFYELEAKLMQEKGLTASKAADWLESNLKSHLKHIPDYKYSGKYKLSVCQNGGKVPVKLNDNIPISDIPDKYLETRIVVNWKAIADDIIEEKQPKSLSGKPLGSVIKRGYHLRIK